MLHVLDCNRILNTAKHSPIGVMRWVLEDDHDKQMSRIKVGVHAKEPSLLSGYIYECPVQARICIPSLVYVFLIPEKNLWYVLQYLYLYLNSIILDKLFSQLNIVKSNIGNQSN